MCASIGTIYIASPMPTIYLFSPSYFIHNQNPYKSTTYLCYPQSIHNVIHYPQAQSAPKCVIPAPISCKMRHLCASVQ